MSTTELILIVILGCNLLATGFLLFNHFKKASFLNKKDSVNDKDVASQLNSDEIDLLSKQFEDYVHGTTKFFQKIGFRRFNPFHEIGGDQSFVLVILNNDNTGFILSSLHQRDSTRVYAKDVISGECKHKMSKEEEEVLKETTAK